MIFGILKLLSKILLGHGLAGAHCFLYEVVVLQSSNKYSYVCKDPQGILYSEVAVIRSEERRLAIGEGTVAGWNKDTNISR